MAIGLDYIRIAILAVYPTVGLGKVLEVLEAVATGK
jgi:hypothetical protein